MTREEQRRRFAARETDPLKQWKLSPIDKASLDKWDDYTEAKEAMFFNTDTADAPWTIVKSDDKKRARINAMHHFLSSLPYPNKDRHVVVGPDPLIVGSSALVIGAAENILETSMHPAKRRKVGEVRLLRGFPVLVARRLFLVGRHLERPQRRGPESDEMRDVSGVPAARHDDAADPRNVVAGVERIPTGRSGTPRTRRKNPSAPGSGGTPISPR